MCPGYHKTPSPSGLFNGSSQTLGCPVWVALPAWEFTQYRSVMSLQHGICACLLLCWVPAARYARADPGSAAWDF